jgi:hypothetical protein
MAVLLARVLPPLPTRAHVPYGKLLRSVFACLQAHRTVQVTLLISGSVFASALWQRGGWRTMMLGGGVLVTFALVVWLTQRKGALVVAAAHHS